MTAALASARFADSKAHYPVLDGLRGVAALLVVAFHLAEPHGPNRFEQWINHGYLAVDFFFVLSGFVIGYAYDDRWRSMSLREFFTRRLIRLHPMIVAAMLIGALALPFQASGVFPKLGQASAWQVVLTMLVGMTLLPLPPSLDIRGWGEMHPLVGPGWSLFFEYVANVLYALFVRRFSNLALGMLVLLAGSALTYYLVAGPNGDVIGGWSLAPVQLQLGFTRLMYPFFAGLLLSRLVRPGRVRHGFLIAGGLLAGAMVMPRFGGPQALWMNGLYEAFCIVVLFPAVVWLGASAVSTPGPLARASDFLGAVSYPVYIVHYPFIYIYTAWVVDNKIPLRQGLPVAGLVFFGSLALAWLCLRYYDIPVRRWLMRRLAAKDRQAQAPAASKA